MNSFLLATAALALVTGASLAPAAAAALPGPRSSSGNNWPGMTQSTGSAYAINPATGAAVYPVYHTMPVPSSGDYPGPEAHRPGEP